MYTGLSSGQTTSIFNKVLAQYDPVLTINLTANAFPYNVGAFISYVFPEGFEKSAAYRRGRKHGGREGFSAPNLSQGAGPPNSKHLFFLFFPSNASH